MMAVLHLPAADIYSPELQFVLAALIMKVFTVILLFCVLHASAAAWDFVSSFLRVKERSEVDSSGSRKTQEYNQNDANLELCRSTVPVHTTTPALCKNTLFLTFSTPETWRYVNISFHQPSVFLPSCRITNPTKSMTCIIFPLLRADQSPDPSYSKRSFEMLAGLQRRFQHCSL